MVGFLGSPKQTKVIAATLARRKRLIGEIRALMRPRSTIAGCHPSRRVMLLAAGRLAGKSYLPPCTLPLVTVHRCALAIVAITTARIYEAAWPHHQNPRRLRFLLPFLASNPAGDDLITRVR